MAKASGKTTKVAAIYARISLDRKGESESPERQVALCQALIEARGWTVGEVFIDRDASAYKKVARPAFERMWEGVEAGRFDVVVAWKLDRVTRRFIDTGTIIGRLQDAGAELVTVTDNIDTSTPLGQSILGVLVAQAETESRNTSLRVSAAWEAKAAQGKPHVAGRRCFGYTSTFEWNKKEAREARRIVDRILAGDSLNGVATDLNRRGILTAAGGAWNHGNLRQWLAAPALAGIRRHNGVDTQGTWEGIITPEEREALLVRLGNVRGGGGTRQAPVHLLTGLVVCGRCGEKMSVHAGRYTCSKLPDGKACGKVAASEERVDEVVVDRLLYFLAAAEAQPLPVEQDPSVLADAIEVDEERLERLNRACFVDGDMTREEWKPQRDAIVERLDATRAALVVLEAGSVLRPGTPEELVAWWVDASVVERRAALRDAFVTVAINPASKQGCKFDTGRVQMEWKVLADLTPVATVEVPGLIEGSANVYVVPGGRLNR
jgi:DNA invertase Pin-like site-specific DNA recombinase